MNLRSIGSKVRLVQSEALGRWGGAEVVITGNMDFQNHPYYKVEFEGETGLVLESEIVRNDETGNDASGSYFSS